MWLISQLLQRIIFKVQRIAFPSPTNMVVRHIYNHKTQIQDKKMQFKILEFWHFIDILVKSSWCMPDNSQAIICYNRNIFMRKVCSYCIVITIYVILEYSDFHVFRSPVNGNCLLFTFSVDMCGDSRWPATFLKRDSSTSVFLWN